jgi:hypothetical protein
MSSSQWRHDSTEKWVTPDGKVVATVVSPQARNIVIPGLTPGVIHTLQGRGVGGSTGFSDWSAPASHMGM